jgi:hypothetical protein
MVLMNSLLVFVLVGCATEPAPAPPPPADPWVDAAAMDKRAPIPLTPMMAEHQKGMMRDHLVAVQEIVRVGIPASAAHAARLEPSEALRHT